MTEKTQSNLGKLDARQQIYETAKQLFYSDGYLSTTMRKIAQTAGISLGLPIYYFGSKESLGVEIYKEFRAQLNTACQLLYPMDTHPLQCRHFSTLADSALLLENESLKELYVHVANSSEMGRFMQQILPVRQDEDEALHRLRLLNSLTVATVKANIINANLTQFDIPITQDDLLAFLFSRYIRLQEPEQHNNISEMFDQFYADYRRFNFRLEDKFRLVYDTDFLQTRNEG